MTKVPVKDARRDISIGIATEKVLGFVRPAVRKHLEAGLPRNVTFTTVAAVDEAHDVVVTVRVRAR